MMVASGVAINTVQQTLSLTFSLCSGVDVKWQQWVEIKNYLVVMIHS